MTTLIVPQSLFWHTPLADKILDDFFEAIDYEARTGFVTRVCLAGTKDDRPVYKPLDGMTWIEGLLDDLQNS